jgi:hypothetical protein
VFANDIKFTGSGGAPSRGLFALPVGFPGGPRVTTVSTTTTQTVTGMVTVATTVDVTTHSANTIKNFGG